MDSNKNGIWAFLTGMAVLCACSNTKTSKPVDNVHETKQLPAEAAKVAKTADTTAFFESLLKKYPQYFGEVLKNSSAWNVQIIYTQINRRANGIADLTHHYYNLNRDKYFYPASTVKLPVVLLALQKLNKLKENGINPGTSMTTETGFTGQTAVYNDPGSLDGRPSIAQYIKKILLVSDNDAFNRLYEFLGQEYINAELKKKGYASAAILHRLNIFLSEAQNRQTNPVKFYDSSAKVLYEQAAQNNQAPYGVRKDSLGKGYYAGGKLINAPMDFSKKNRLALEDLHRILIGIVFPDKVKASERFNITEEDRLFVLKHMGMYPTESQYPPYAADTANYWPAYCKFLFYGAEKGSPQQNIRIFNKVGDAYGHMIDAAYMVDYKNKIEFFVSAIIYCNSDGILNDDKYDYNTIGLPFMKNLGRVIYDYELKRKYKNRPDLSSVSFAYDK
jgi:hypothetical protein